MAGHRSVSQLTSYSGCGEAYRLERIARAPQRPAAWFTMGTATHAAIEAWEKSERQIADAEAIRIYDEAYKEGINKSLEKYPDENAWMTGGRKKGFADMEDRQAIGAWQVADYMRFAREHDNLWRVVYSEVKFEMEFGGVNVLGYIDQIRQYADGRFIAVDLKSGSTTPPAPVQLAVYGHAVHANLGQLPATGSFVKLGRPKTGAATSKEKPTADIDHDLTAWSKERLDRWFADMDRSEKAGLYLPNPGDNCARTCGVAQFCSVMGHPESAAQYAPKVAA